MNWTAKTIASTFKMISWARFSTRPFPQHCRHLTAYFWDNFLTQAFRQPYQKGEIQALLPQTALKSPEVSSTEGTQCKRRGKVQNFTILRLKKTVQNLQNHS